MTTPLTSIQGLSSGIKWQDLVDELIAADTANELTPLKTAATTKQASLDAWKSYGTAVSTLQSAAKAMADGTAFGQLAVSAPNSPTTSRTLLTATADSTAVAGSYSVQVLSTATAQQLSGNIVSDANAALGLSGQFAVGGKILTVQANDSLSAVRDRINQLNTGTTPTHVTASILQVGGSSARLVLSSDVGGASGVDLRDVRATSASPSLLTQLGIIDGKTTNVGTDGAARSAQFVSSSEKIALLALGASVYPAPATIIINGRTVTVDLENQSLLTIAAMVNAQQPNTASVEAVTNGGSTSYRLKLAGSVAATADPGSQPVLDLLGLSRGTTGVVRQQVSTSNALQDSTGTTATGTTLLAGLQLAGGRGAQVGDTFTFSGTKADGVTPVALTETVDGTRTIDDMLGDISAAFSASGRHVSAAIVDGKIQLTDDTGGDSGLTLSAAANNESSIADSNAGATLSFGGSVVNVVGRQRELAAGSDARLIVNGVAIARSTNTINDAIPGVTLNVQQAEAGTTIPVTVSRDTSRTLSAIQTFVSSYNALQTLVSSSTASGGALAFNGAVRSSFNTIKSTLLSGVAGLPNGSAFDHAALVGVTLDRSGKLTIDTAKLNSVLASNPDAVKSLFQTNGTTTNSSLSFFGSGPSTAAGRYNAVITRAATTPSVTSSVANFVYAGGSADSMTIGDSTSGKSGTISLVNGDTPDIVASRLNVLFQAQGIRLTAANASGHLTITSLDYGSTPAITTSFTTSDATDIAGQIGVAAGRTHNGLDVQGTLALGGNVYAATGLGQLLTGASGTPAAGLALRYSGTDNSAASEVDFVVGIAGLATRIADQVSRSDGTVAQQTTTLQTSIDDLTGRQTQVQARLDSRKAALLAQYSAMETALSKISAQGTWLTQQINAMNGVKSS